MASLTLYHAAPSRSAIVHWMLEEIGEPFDLHLLDLKKGEGHTPEYLAINPLGKVPVLKHGDTVISEAAAICTYLADEFPHARLNIPVGNPQRGVYLKWLFFGPSCVEPAIMDKAFPRKEAPPPGAIGSGDYDSVVEILAKAAANANPYLMGEQFTAADVIIGSGLRWGTMFNLLPKRSKFTAYLARLAERPALQRAVTKDAELQKQHEAGG
ncbi:glutathione S-transferase family protein [Leptospira interrogans]